MGASQVRARGTLGSHGVRFTDLTTEQRTAVREKMLPDQEHLAKELKISPETVAAMQRDIAGAA
jgi:hypothetical protein